MLLLSSRKVGKVEKYIYSLIEINETQGKVGKVDDSFGLILLLLGISKVGKVKKYFSHKLK